MTLRKLACAAVLFGSLATACGGGGGVDPQTYAADVCAAMNEWQGSLQSASQQMQTLDPNNPEDAKKKIVAFLEGIVERTDQAIAEIEDAGTPDAENGEEASQALVAAFEETKESFEGFRDDIAAVSTDNPQEFQAALQRFGTEMQESLGGLGDRFDKIDSDELEKAFDDEESCENVAS